MIWVTPGRLIERLDDYRGRITCTTCGDTDEFSRSDDAKMTNASLARGWMGWDCSCDPDRFKFTGPKYGEP